MLSSVGITGAVKICLQTSIRSWFVFFHSALLVIFMPTVDCFQFLSVSFCCILSCYPCLQHLPTLRCNIFVLLHRAGVTGLLVGTVFVLVQVNPSFRRRIRHSWASWFSPLTTSFVDLCVPNEFSCLPLTPDVASYMSGTTRECGLEGVFHCLFHKPKKRRDRTRAPSLRWSLQACVGARICAQLSVLLGIRRDFSCVIFQRRQVLKN